MPSRSTRVFRHLANSAGLMLFLALAVPSRGQIQVLGVTDRRGLLRGRVSHAIAFYTCLPASGEQRWPNAVPGASCPVSRPDPSLGRYRSEGSFEREGISCHRVLHVSSGIWRTALA